MTEEYKPLDDEQIDYLVDTFIRPAIVDAIKQQAKCVASLDQFRISIVNYLDSLRINGNKVFGC